MGKREDEKAHCCTKEKCDARAWKGKKKPKVTVLQPSQSAKRRFRQNRMRMKNGKGSVGEHTTVGGEK